MVDVVLAEARKTPGLLNLDSDLKLNKPEIKVSVHRDKAADMGVSLEAMGRTVETLLGGRQVTRFKREGEQYEVIVQVARSEEHTSELQSLMRISYAVFC